MGNTYEERTFRLTRDPIQHEKDWELAYVISEKHGISGDRFQKKASFHLHFTAPVDTFDGKTVCLYEGRLVSLSKYEEVRAHINSFLSSFEHDFVVRYSGGSCLSIDTGLYKGTSLDHNILNKNRIEVPDEYCTLTPS